MQKVWFKKWGWLYRPISISGWILNILAILFNIQIFLAIDRQSHSASDTLYGLFPYLISTFLLLMWIASQTNRQTK